MSMDEQQAFLYDVGGRQTAVAHGAVEQFERDHPDAYRLSLFDDGSGTPRIVAQENAEAFRRENPGAQPVHLFDVDGKPRAVARSALGGFLEEARAKEQARMDGPRPEKKSVARDLLDVAASRAGAAGLGVATAPGELLGGIASAVGGVDRSTPEGRAIREHQERGDTWNGVTQSWDRAQPTISADRRNWAQRQWDKVRGGVVRANQNFNDALVELGHGLRDWREGTKARPTTIAGEVVAPVADTAATLGKYALLAPTGLGGGVMAAEGASESLARTEGRTDLSATDRLALAAAGGAANAAIYGAAGARATAPVSEAILRRASSGAAGQLVSGGGARMAADALKMGAASAAGDIAAAEPVDVRRAAQAAQEGALIGFASGAAASAPRAIEASARETARRMMDPATEASRLREAAEARYVEAQRGRAAEAADELASVNPAATLGRIADEIPADLARAGENLEAAAVPESPMDAYARRKAAEANPASDFAGELGREFLENGPRNTGKTGNEPPPEITPEELAMDYPGTQQVKVAPVAKSPTPPRAKLPEEVAHDKAEAARQEAVAALEQARQSGDFQAVVAAMKKVQSAARKEDNARKKMEAAVAKAETPPQEQAAAPAIAPEDQATVPDADGKPRAVPGFLKPEPARVKKGAYAAVTNGERGVSGNVYYGEIVSVGPKNIKIRSKNDFYKSEHVLTFPRSQILGIEADPGALDRKATEGKGVRADIAAETPRLGDAAPKRGIRSELQVLLDAGERDAATLEDLAKRAEAEDAFETAALARQAAGTYRGSPWNTEGGNWPHEEPPAARASFGDLFTLARNLGEGKAPEFVRRISRLPWAEGVFRFDEGDPASGRIQERSGLLRLVPDARIEAIRSEAQAEAAAKGLSPEQAQTLFSRKLRSAIRESAFAGPKPAMAVLAHEIGHWVDFLDEGTLKRGNVLGHIAALKRWGQRQIYPTKAAADAAGVPGLTRAEVRAKAKEWKVSEGEARRRLVEERDMAALPDLRREMESLVAWYRQSDGAPEYFRSSPSELYAEAFSAWVNYPAEVARRAPAFAAILDGWMDARPEAARALREFRDGVTQAEARAAKAAGDVTNPAFFAALDQESGAARRAEDLAGRLTDEALSRGDLPEGRGAGTGGKFVDNAWAKAKIAFTGPDDILKGELMRSAQGAFDAHNLPLWRAMQQKDNANNRMVLWDYRFRTHVEPLLQGVPHETFLNYLYHSRVANELLGPDATRGRMNLPNTNGLTPGDVSRAEGNAQTSSAAWLNELRRTHPEIAEKCERARREFWNKVRNGGDELGGEGSPMDVIRNSPCLSAEQKAALLGNEWYVAFRPAVVPDVSRAVSTGEMSVWDGIFSQRTGSEKPVGDVLANTLLQDLTMQDQLLRQEYRLRAVDWLRNNKSEWIGERVEPVFDKATGRASVPQREKTGWRVVAFLRNGRPEGWWVRDFIADALAPKPHQVSSLEGWRGLANKSARGINALKTTLNPAFGVANTLKDAFSIALRQLPSGTTGAGHAAALLNGARNWLGDYGAMMRSFRDTSAADIIHGKWNPDAARALAWGALNNAAPNQSAYAGGGEKGGVGELAARYRELGRSEVSDKDLRAALKTFGYSERQISGALDRTESRLVSALREAARVTGARWAAEQHGRVMAFLSRGEIRTKSFALAEAMRRRPDLTREEAVQWVHDMIGTPAMNNRPALSKLPGIGHVVPFLTPRVHGWTDQLYGALRSGWTGGPGQSAQVASRIAFATTMMAIPLAAVGILRGEAEEAEKRGDKERAAALRGMARRWQAIPSTDILTGICFPNPLGKNTHIKIPVDPTIVPIAGLALEKIFGGGGRNLAPGAGMEQFTGDLLPTVGTAPTLYLGNRSGRDPNTGRQVVGERTPGLDRALWNWDQLTARGLGMLPGSMLRAWMAGSEDAREMERASRADQIPVVSALWRPFLRRSGYGLVERANVMRELNAADGKRAQKDSEAIAAGKQLPPDEEEWYYSHVTDPDGMIDRAAERADRLRTMTPDERAFEGLPAIRADEIAERAGYIAPSR